MTTFNPATAHGAEVIATASIFTAFVKFGPFDRRKVEFEVQDGDREATLDRAKAHAQEAADRLSRPILIYAVNPHGRSALVTTIRPQG